MLPTRFRFIWPSGFRGEDLLEIDEPDSIIGCSRHVLTDRDEMSNRYRGSSIDAAYQISVHLAKRWFQRGIFTFEKVTDDGRRMLCDDKSSDGLWPGELKTNKQNRNTQHNTKPIKDKSKVDKRKKKEMEQQRCSYPSLRNFFRHK